MSFGYSKIQNLTPNRVAIYARYSSDLQRPSSIEDQIRECKEAAVRNGWTVAEEFIRSDESSSGQVLVGRDGLDELMTLAQDPSKPYDGVLIDDTSRFGRNLSDTLPLSDLLETTSSGSRQPASLSIKNGPLLTNRLSYTCTLRAATASEGDSRTFLRITGSTDLPTGCN